MLRLFARLFSFFDATGEAADDAAAEQWATAITRNGEHAIVYRYLKRLSPHTPQALQTQRATLTWKYESDSGMPSQTERRQMDQLEEQLFRCLTPDHFASLAMVATGERLRKWTYYAQSESEFFDRLESVTHGAVRYPIEVRVVADPHWGAYESFRTRINA